MKPIWRLTIGLGVALLISLLNMARFGQVQPRMMGDELIYSQNVLLRPIGEITHPNYLYQLIYQPVGLCGDNFYLCTKWLNTGFLLLFGLLLYLIAAGLVRRRWAAVLAVATVLGPISIYSSFFTPDIMFFAIALATVWSYLRRPFGSAVANWVLIGSMLTLALLTKPHAIVLLLAIVMAEGWDGWRGGWRIALRQMIAPVLVSSGAFMAKLTVGFAVAGVAGLGIFGGQYEYGVTQTLDSESIPMPESPEGQGSAETLSWFATMSRIGGLHFGLQLLIQIGLLVLFFAPLLAIAFSLRHDDKSGRLARLSLSAIGFGIVLSSAFVAIAPAWGESLGARAMVRYYEYAVWLLPIFAAVALSSFRLTRPKNLWAIISLGVLSVTALWLAISETPKFFTDFSLLGAVGASGELWLWLIALVSLVTAGMLLTSPRTSQRVWALVAAPVILLSGWVGTGVAVIQPGLQTNPYLESAAWLRANPDLGDYGTLILVGNDRRLLQTSQFWLRDVDVWLIDLPVDGEVDLNDINKDSLVVLIDSVDTPTELNVLHEAEYFTVGTRTSKSPKN